ncbi:MAG TPA: methionyl-tRNA formyltransferase [Acidimicrobiales bacterium]|nr:methionyl-tRNA formyltransferase [Acidimicrobiales bacterium]
MTRIAYLGTPEAAVPPLEALLDAGHDIALVVSQPDRRRGRGGALLPSPVKAVAQARGVPVTDRVDDVLDADVELGVVVAFGRLIKPHVLDKVPMVNIHFSLLPRWRGAAPVERAILAGDTETGVCLMQLEEGLDTGPVYALERVPIGSEETADELRARLVTIGSRLLVERLGGGLGEPVPQEGEPTYAAKVEPHELHIDWSQPAEHVHRVARLGKAWTTFRGKRLRVLRARPVPAAAGAPGELEGLVVAAGDGAGVELVEVQPEGKSAQLATAWANGARPQPGERLGR